MNRPMISVIAIAAAAAMFPSTGSGQGGRQHHVQLHVNPRWDECAFQLDPSLTQHAWRQFTREAGVVTYFRPLTGARPLGAGNFEISVLQSQTGIDDTDAAWNDTFVHPDSTHWLFEGSGLAIPSLMARAGVTDRIDVGAYFTRNPNSNYGFFGGQAQYNVIQEATAGVAASARVSLVSLFGPEDLDFTMYGLDVVASRQYPVFSTWAAVTPYAGVSGYLSSAHEKTAAISLADERALGVQAMVGAVAQIAVARIAVEYSTASVRARTLRVGVAF